MQVASVDAAIADRALLRLEVDARGLDGMDRRYLRAIAENYRGGPVGIETMAAVLGEQRDVIEEVVEPYLMQQGFMQRTPRGRMLTETAYRHLDLPPPAEPAGAARSARGLPPRRVMRVTCGNSRTMG